MARRGKLGAVIAAICRDLSLVSGVAVQQPWKEVADLIIRFGRNFARLITDVFLHIQNRIAEAAFTETLAPAAIDRLHHAIFAGAGSP